MIGLSASPQWELQEFVSVAEAALITGRSRTWVRSQLMSQGLAKHQARTGANRREIYVCTASIKRLLQRRGQAQTNALRIKSNHPVLRLIVDNTK